jgi:hypothetical protein
LEAAAAWDVAIPRLANLGSKEEAKTRPANPRGIILKDLPQAGFLSPYKFN